MLSTGFQPGAAGFAPGRAIARQYGMGAGGDLAADLGQVQGQGADVEARQSHVPVSGRVLAKALRLS